MVMKAPKKQEKKTFHKDKSLLEHLSQLAWSKIREVTGSGVTETPVQHTEDCED